MSGDADRRCSNCGAEGERQGYTLFGEAGVDMRCPRCGEEWWYSMEFTAPRTISRPGRDLNDASPR